MATVRLEDFSGPGRAPGSKGPGADRDAPSDGEAKQDLAQLEQARLAGYEAGYQAGWDDAITQEAEAQGRIGAEFARNLQDLGFTFHEARAHVMEALEPLLTGMIDTVLPELVSRTLGQSILEELMGLAEQAADTPIEVVVTPANRATIGSMLGGAAVPFTIVEEPTLADGQVYLRSGQAEKRIDMTRAIDRIGVAINGLYDLNEGAFENG